jgi:aryl-alcohol dehydrogenase-like predicted oxidoreductase
LAWAIATKDTSTAILGFSRVSQIEENMGAIALLEKWTKDLEQRVNEILNNAPELEIDYRTWGPTKVRRLQ